MVDKADGIQLRSSTTLRKERSLIDGAIFKHGDCSRSRKSDMFL